MPKLAAAFVKGEQMKAIAKKLFYISDIIRKRRKRVARGEPQRTPGKKEA
jgi:hypothetical protein